MLPKQTQEDRKSPIKVMRLRFSHINPLVEKAKLISIRLSIFLISTKFLLRHLTLLAIGNINAKMITKGVSETS